jgi:hypothetical protein
MTPLDLVLSRCEGAREVAPGRWRACCPAHGGKNRGTLAVSEGDVGQVLMHCFAGCEFGAVVRSMGLQASDLYPARPQAPGSGSSGLGHPFVAQQVFEALRFEAQVVYLIGSEMQARRAINESEFRRLGTALGRINDVARVYRRGNHR